MAAAWTTCAASSSGDPGRLRRLRLSVVGADLPDARLLKSRATSARKPDICDARPADRREGLPLRPLALADLTPAWAAYLASSTTQGADHSGHLDIQPTVKSCVGCYMDGRRRWRFKPQRSRRALCHRGSLSTLSARRPAPPFPSKMTRVSDCVQAGDEAVAVPLRERLRAAVEHQIARRDHRYPIVAGFANSGRVSG